MRQRTGRVAATVGIVTALVVGGVALGLSVSSTASATSSAGSASAACGGSASRLTVQGTGNASATPDLLTVSVTIDVTGPSAQASLVDDNSRASAVTAVLKQGGVTERDIQTSNVSIQPNYNLAGNITGYAMTNTLTAKLRNFSTAGSVIDALTAAAGNATRVDSLTFSIEDPRAIEDKARTDAVHQAVSHARSMAQAAGERLGPVCSLSDESSTNYVVPSALDARAAASQNSVVPLQAGNQQVSAHVTVVYALEQPPSRR
jgi:uncharacterized protein YggE